MDSKLMLIAGAAAGGLIIMLVVVCANVYYWCWYRKGRGRSKKLKVTGRLLYRDGYQPLQSAPPQLNISKDFVSEKTDKPDPYPFPPQRPTTPSVSALWQQDPGNLPPPGPAPVLERPPGKNRSRHRASSLQVGSAADSRSRSLPLSASLDPPSRSRSPRPRPLSSAGPHPLQRGKRVERSPSPYMIKSPPLSPVPLASPPSRSTPLGSPPSRSDLDVEESMSLRSTPVTRQRSLASENEYDPLKEPPGKPPPALPSLLVSSMDEHAATADLEGESVSSPSAGLGKLQFHLEFLGTEAIRFHLHQAKDLPGMDISGYSDPYVEIYMLDMKMLTVDGQVLKKLSQWRSQYQKKTLNPIFNERHDFPVPTSVPFSRLGFLLHIFDYDFASRDDLIGHVWIPVKDFNVSSGPTAWRYVQPGKKVKLSSGDDVELGEVEVSLSYDEEQRHLLIVLHRASHLKLTASSPADTVAKVRLYHRNFKLASKETEKFRGNFSPEYNGTFHYRLSRQAKIDQILVAITIYQLGVVSRKPVGGVNIGNGRYAHQSGSAQWLDMLHCRGAASTVLHQLQPYLPVKSEVDKPSPTYPSRG